MTANPGRLAICDRDGCAAESRIYRGQDTGQSLRDAGWSYTPERQLCPAHSTLRARMEDATLVILPMQREGRVNTLVETVVEWLRVKAEQYGDVGLSNLAMYAEDGEA